jgi:hypothetical protein
MTYAPETDTEKTRAWLNEQGIFEFILKAINGEIINNERLSLRNRTSAAIKLSNKLLPDLKSTEMKKTETVDINVRYTATQALISDILDQ